MPNQFKFEVYFRKADILEILNEEATDLIVYGGVAYDASTGASTMEIFAESIAPGQGETATKEGCPMPCSQTSSGSMIEAL